MLGQSVGKATLVKEPKKTTYFWGPMEEIAGKTLPVWERNFKGDCLCFLEGRGLIDVEACDVETFVPAPPDPFNVIMDLVKMAKKRRKK